MTPDQLNAQIRQATKYIASVFETPSRPGSTGKPTAVQGEMFHAKISRRVPFHSSIERDFLLACKLDRRIEDIKSQPFTLSFTTSASSTRMRYTPDYYLKRDLGVYPSQFQMASSAIELIVEVKRRADLKFLSESDIERLAAAAFWSKQSPHRDFIIITDDYFLGETGEAIRLLSGYVEDSATDAALALIAFCKRSSPLALSIAYDLLTMSGYSRSEAEEAILLSIANGWIETPEFKIPSNGDELYWRNPNEVPDTETGQNNGSPHNQ